MRQLRSKPRTSENDDWSCKPTFFARSNASANEEVEEEDMSQNTEVPNWTCVKVNKFVKMVRKKVVKKCLGF